MNSLPLTRSYLSSIFKSQYQETNQHRRSSINSSPISSSSSSIHSLTAIIQPTTLSPTNTHSTSLSSNSNSSSSSNSSTTTTTTTTTTATTTSNNNNNNNNNLIDQLIQTILSILSDSQDDDDEKPDRLKSFLSNSTHLNLLPDHQLNDLVLSLLHQHRQDLHPSQSSSELPLAQKTTTRFSFPSTLNRSTSSASSSSSSHYSIISKSRFQPRSPLPSSSSPSTPHISIRYLDHSNPSSPAAIDQKHLSPSSSPFQPASHSAASKLIPPALNLHAPSSSFDKLRPSASEFRPNLNRAGSTPYQSSSTHHPQPISPSLSSRPHSARLWNLGGSHSFGNISPQKTNLHSSPSPSPLTAHFPRSRPTTPDIPRDPWLKDDDDYNQQVGPRTASPLADSQSNHIINNHFDLSSDSLDLFSPFRNDEGFKSPLPALSTNFEKLSAEPSCPSALRWGLSPEMAEEMAQFTVWDQSDSDGSLPPTIVHHPPEEDDELFGGYVMTPFDELCSTLSGTGVAVSQIEEALVQCGYDISKAMDWLLERHGISFQSNQPHDRLLTIDRSLRNSSRSRDSSPVRLPISSVPPTSGSLPSSPRFASRQQPSTNSPPGSQKRSKGNMINLTEEPQSSELNSSHRVCRFYLQGCCLRSDCKFSHDVGKAICRFWLKGHCLKGESRCDFLHEIPDLTSLQTKQQDQASKNQKASSAKSFADEFPSLSESLVNRPGQSPHNKQKTRLRPVKLLPDRAIDPTPSLLKLCETYKSKCLEFGTRRKECFNLAKECFKRADGAGVKKWSKEADEWNKRLGEEGRGIAGAIIAERNRLMKDAVRDLVSDRAQKVDEGPDRMQRGKEMGGGICLGVIAPASGADHGTLTVKERVEVMMDLHGLHPDDGVYYLEKFLVALKTENFQGLAYVIISESSSSGGSSSSESKEEKRTENEELNGTQKASGESPSEINARKLEKSVKTWLEKKKFDWESCPILLAPNHHLVKTGIVCIDPTRNL